MSDTPETDAIERASTDDTGAVTRMEPIWEGLQKLERERDALCKALELIEDRFVDGESTHDDWLYMGVTARQALAKIKNHHK